MMRRSWYDRGVLRRALLLWFVSACSSDAVPEPELTLDTRGAFIAVVADEGELELYRTLAVIGERSDFDPFFVIPYAVTPRSFEHARELAKDPELPHFDVKAIPRIYITSRDWRLVWFRSVSAEEEEGFR